MSSGSSNRSTSSQQPASSTASTATPTRSIFDSFPSFSMPTLPSMRFHGDGLDFRRPAPTVPVQNTQDIIDLTEDYSPEVLRHPRPSNRANSSFVGLHVNSARQPFRDFIDVDEESTRATVDSSSQSPDLELLEVRSIRSQNTSDAEPRRRTHARPQSALRPPGPSHADNTPFTIGGWGGLRQHAQGHHSNHETARHLHQLFHSNHPLMHQNRGTILPGDLDFVSQGFHMGDVSTRQPQPALPTYDAPDPARQGFTRSPKEDDVLLCPNCEDELGTGKDDSKRQVWVVKACGHVYCGECTKNRSPAKRGRGARVALTKPFTKCVVEGCTNKKVIIGPRSLFQIYL
ncbi:MAG: hypothetical protein Q9213_003350 [Squamulea squamosa]